MEREINFNSFWKALFIVGSIVTAAFAVDTRYVTDSVFTEFKEGTIASISARLDRIESKLDALLADKQR
jgi:hypothetical protein